MSNTENILKYNNLIQDIVKNFAIRYYNEWEDEKVEVDNTDYRIINYAWINQWPVDICDMFFSIDDILIAEMYNIPIETFIEYYDLCLSKKWIPGINLYNYWKLNNNNKQ